MRLGLWMPFPKAAHLLADRMGVQISEATGRRQTEAAGAAYEQGQDEQASQLLEAKNKQSNKSTGCSSKPKKSKAHPEQIKLLISSDGAKVGLLKGEWAEIKTRVIGQVKAKEQHGKQRTEQVVETVDLSSFSRLTDCSTCGSPATGETERRGVCTAQEVWAVQDGAEWLQGFVDLHRPDALRILDFAHAAGSSFRDCRAGQGGWDHPGRGLARDALA